MSGFGSPLCLTHDCVHAALKTTSRPAPEKLGTVTMLRGLGKSSEEKMTASSEKFVV
jgi:hypothetical protein